MIDASLMKFLTPEHAARMRAYEVLFSSEGWKYLKAEFERQLVLAEQGALSATSWPENRIQTGRMGVLVSLVNLEETFAQEFEQAALEAQAVTMDEEIEQELEYE